MARAFHFHDNGWNILSQRGKGACEGYKHDVPGGDFGTGLNCALQYVRTVIMFNTLFCDVSFETVREINAANK